MTFYIGRIADESTRRLANKEYVVYVHNKLLYNANILQYVSGFPIDNR